MQQKERKYYNNAVLIKASRARVGQNELPALKLTFNVWDRDTKEQVKKFKTLFLTQENNERNQEIFQFLGVEDVPDVCNFEAMPELKKLGTRTVSLVEQENNNGYTEIAFINEDKFGVRVFDL